jgi:hypothetical protein
MAGVLKVTAPYVTLKVTDDNGQPVVRGFYEGALVPVDQVAESSVAHHVKSGMAEVVADAPDEAGASARSSRSTASRSSKD